MKCGQGKRSGKFVPVLNQLSTTVRRRTEGGDTAPPSFTWTLDYGCELQALTALPPAEKTASTQWIGRWVQARAGLNDVENGTNSFRLSGIETHRPVRNPSLYGLSSAVGDKHYQIKVRDFFRLRNVNIVGFYYLFNCYIRPSSGRNIFARTYSTNNGFGHTTSYDRNK
jgi:hypothetical protein